MPQKNSATFQINGPESDWPAGANSTWFSRAVLSPPPSGLPGCPTGAQWSEAPAHPHAPCWPGSGSDGQFVLTLNSFSGHLERPLKPAKTNCPPLFWPGQHRGMAGPVSGPLVAAALPNVTEGFMKCIGAPRAAPPPAGGRPAGAAARWPPHLLRGQPSLLAARRPLLGVRLVPGQPRGHYGYTDTSGGGDEGAGMWGRGKQGW